MQDKLQFYVYLLTGPRSGKVFYVGKGTGNRIFAHARAALDRSQASDKLDRIREIHESGLAVRYELLRFGLTEQTAFEVEAAAMQLLDGLDNIVAGQHVGSRGRMTTDVVISLFDPSPAPAIVEPVLILRLPQLWHPAMPAEELYDATAAGGRG